MVEINIPLPDTLELRWSDYRDHFQGGRTHPVPGIAGNDRCREHHTIRTHVIQRRCRCEYGGAGGDAIVDKKYVPLAHVDRELTETVDSFPPIYLCSLLFHNVCERFVGQMKRVDDFLVENPNAVWSDGAHREFGVSWQSEFSDHKDIQG